MLSIRPSISIVAKDTIFYGISSFLSRSITLLTLPLLARHFTVEDYGKFDLYYLSISLMITFFLFGQDSAIFRYFYDQKNDKDRRCIVTQTIIFQLIVASSAILFFYLSKGALVEYFNFSNESIKFIEIILLIVPFGILYTLAECILRLTRDLKKYILLTIGFVLAMFSLVFYGTQISEADLDSFFKYFLYLYILFGILGFCLIIKWIEIPQKPRNIKKMIYYGLPMVAVVFVESSQPVVERLIVSNFISMQSLGLYSVGAKLAMIVLLPVTAFNMAFMPLVMKIYRQPDAIQLFNTSLTIYITFLSVLVLIICAAAEPLVILLAGEEYIDGSTIIFPLSIALYFHGIGSIVGIGTIISQKTYIRFLIHVLTLIFTYTLMVKMAVTFGISGVAIAAAMGKYLMFILYAFFGQRLYPFRWNYLMVAVMTTITVIYGIFLFYNEIHSSLEVIIFLISLIMIMRLGWFFLSPENKKILRIRV